MVNAKGVECVTNHHWAGQSLQWCLRAVQFLENGDLLFDGIGGPVRAKLKKGGRQHSLTHVRSGANSGHREAVNRKLGLSRVIDLSATPFFLRGSGYAEGTLFPWTMSDFSLMDAIECGIVKLPRVPVAENIPGDEMPMFRDLWENIRKDMPKKGRGQGEELDPLKLPIRLQTALEALYGHEKTFKLWEDNGIKVPRPASSSSARTPPSRSSFTISSRAFIAKTMIAPRLWRTGAFHGFVILTKPPATHFRARTRCSSTASSSKRAMRSTTTFAAWLLTRSSAFAVRSWNAAVMPMPVTTSPTRNCSARS